MNPIEFHEQGYADILNDKQGTICRIQVLGPKGISVKGMFMCVRQCTDQELTHMAGFIADVPIYKICIMAEGERFIPMWINTLLIDHFSDIQFT